MPGQTAPHDPIPLPGPPADPAEPYEPIAPSPEDPPPDPPTKPAGTRIIALLNQKGGVGKTTTTVNLGAALARRGANVLLVDLDPQAHLTLHVGIDPEQLDATMYDLFIEDDVTGADIIEQADERLFVLPAQVNLAGVEAELAPKMMTGQAQRLLAGKMASLLRGDMAAPLPKRFEYILIDCPPSLGLLTINALTVAREVFVPMQSHFLALQGLSKLLETVGFIRQGFNPRLEVTGLILCMHEQQTILAQEVVADLKQFLEAATEQDVPWRRASLLEPPIRRNVKLAESPSFGQTIFDYEPSCAGASDYLRLADSVAQQSVEGQG